MQQKSAVEQGWMFASSIMGADIAASIGTGCSDYIKGVEKAISDLESAINNNPNRNLGLKQLQGVLFEEWSAGTFNINAKAANSSLTAEALHSKKLFSVDIAVKNSDGSVVKNYSAKSYENGPKSAVEQARMNLTTRRAGYEGQYRLVPSDQLPYAIDEAKRRASRNLDRPEVAEAYRETQNMLTDKVDVDDVHSKTVSRKELDAIARESKEQKFSAEKHDITVENTIQTQYLVKQVLKAGYTAAAVTIAMQLTPEILKTIDYLIKHGELDIQQIRRIGTKGLTAGAEGFIRGSVSASLMIMCQTGMLGEAFQTITPGVLGTVVALSMQTIKNSILVAAGKMSSRQMGSAFVDSVIISGGYLAGAHIGGFIGQALGFQLPVVGYLLGSLVGTSFCVVYNIGKKKLISFCVDTGFTCFGLVEQDYQLPEEVLDEIGVETIPVPRTQVERIEVPRVDVHATDVWKADYETVNLTVLRRGVIGVNRVGYVTK